MNMPWSIILSWCLMLMCSSTIAQDMYVSPFGKGSSCNITAPCSIESIATLHTNYKTIQFWRGVYNLPEEGITVTNVSLIAVDDKLVTFDCNGGVGFNLNTQQSTISYLMFRNCSTALNISETSNNIAITDSRFTNCGYGVASKSSSLYMRNVIFTNNLFGVWHFGDNQSSVTILETTFKDNGDIDNSDGRAITVFSLSLFVSHCVFDDNSGDKGGSIFSISRNIDVNKCSFNRNKASRGGAIYLQNGYNITIRNSSFISNSGTYGGSIWTDSGSANFGGGSVLLNITSCEFLDNDGTLGGALWANADYTSVSNSSFTNNRATYGGAIYCDTPIRVERSKFFFNVAESGWILMSKGKTLVSFRECTLEGNNGIFQNINEGGKAVEVMPFPRYECTSLFNSLMCGNTTSFANYNGYIWDLSKLNNSCLVESAFPCYCISSGYHSEHCRITNDGVIVSEKLAPDFNVTFTDMFIEPFVGGLGDTPNNAGVSCKDIYRKRGDLGLGVFYISIRRTVFPVLCDSSIFPGQVATMLFKVNSGQEGDVLENFSRAFLNSKVSSLLNLTHASQFYLSNLNEFWDRFDTVSLRLYSEEQTVAYINFDSPSQPLSPSPSLSPSLSPRLSFFSKSNVISSSWNDLALAPPFSHSDNFTTRQFLIANTITGGDCSTELGWMMISDSNDSCGPVGQKGLSLQYSASPHRTFLYNLSSADVFLIWVKDNYYESSDAPIISPYPTVPTNVPPRPNDNNPKTHKRKDGTLIAVAVLLPILFVAVAALAAFYVISYRQKPPKYSKGEKSYSPSRETSLVNFGHIQPFVELQKDSPIQKQQLQKQAEDIERQLRLSLGPEEEGEEERQNKFMKEEETPKPTSKREPIRRHNRMPKKEISLIFGVTLGSIIGKGSFGAVYSGTWSGAKVAVKAITSQDFSDLYNEAFVLRSMRHPNIVQFYGLFDKDDQYYIVTEFVEGGSLDSLLKAKANYFSIPDLVRLARDAAWGMQLLEQKKVLHRDLASRNLLVDLTRQQMTVRVADFGMSRVAESYVAPANSLTPIKWSAPEVLKDRSYTSKSDVWSLGIVMWEMLNGGAEPYTYMTNKEAKEMIIAGNLLTLPPTTPPLLKQLIHKCWSPDPKDRPTFVEIADELTKVLDVISEPKKEQTTHTITTPQQQQQQQPTNVYESPYALPVSLQTPDLQSPPLYVVDEQGNAKDTKETKETQETKKLDVLRECAEACARESLERGIAYANNTLCIEQDPFRFYEDAGPSGKGTTSTKGKSQQTRKGRRGSDLATIAEEDESNPVSLEPMQLVTEPIYMNDVLTNSKSELLSSSNTNINTNENTNENITNNTTPKSSPSPRLTMPNFKIKASPILRSPSSSFSSPKLTSPKLNSFSPKLSSPKLHSPTFTSPKFKSPKFKSPKFNSFSPSLSDPVALNASLSPPSPSPSPSSSSPNHTSPQLNLSRSILSRQITIPNLLDTPNLGISISTPPSLVITDVGSSDPIIEPPFPFYSPPASPVKSPFLIDKLFDDASNDSSYLAPNNNNSNNSNNIILHSPNHSGQLHHSRLLDPFTDSPKKRRSRSPRPRKSDSQDNSNNNNSSLNNSSSSNTSYSSSPGDSSPNEALNNNTNNSNNNIISSNNSNNSSNNNGNRIGAYLYESTEIWKEEPSETSKSVRLAICASPPIRKSPPLQSTNPDSSLNLPSIISPENPAC